MPLKLGRKPRIFDPRIPHYSALRFLRAAPPAPSPAVDWSAALPPDLGMMGNDRLGDCTCAAIYHARQVWSANANPPIDTQPDAAVIAAYEDFCGYNPADPSTDLGGIEQTVLGDWVNHGAPLADGSTDKLLAFVEIDPTNEIDIEMAIEECGVAYIGFAVPAYIMAGGDPPDLWDLPKPSDDASIVGGHAVVLCAYWRAGGSGDVYTFISWGRIYRMTRGFFLKYCDEVYALADRSWIEKTGATPLGLTVDQLEAQMQAISEPLRPVS